MSDEIRTPADVYGRLFEEVGVEHRALIQETLELHMQDPIMTTGSVEDGIKYIVNLAKERLPKPKPEIQPMENGYVYRDGPEASKGETFLDTIARRRQQRRGR